MNGPECEDSIFKKPQKARNTVMEVVSLEHKIYTH